MLAVITANNTSDIMSKPTRPGNKNFCAQKINQTDGKIMSNEISKDNGTASTTAAIGGISTLPINKPTPIAKVEVKMKVQLKMDFFEE